MREKWKDISGYEGLYKVSNLGRVRSFVYWRGTTKRILKPTSKGRQGEQRLCVSLSKIGKKSKTMRIHRLVLESFISPCPLGMECRHLNGNPFDNKLSNLKWGTHSENVLDAVGHGTHVDNSGSNNGRSKLVDVDILKIRQLGKLGRNGNTGQKLSCREIAEIFNVDGKTIYNIIKNTAWQHIQ